MLFCYTLELKIFGENVKNILEGRFSGMTGSVLMIRFIWMLFKKNGD